MDKKYQRVIQEAYGRGRWDANKHKRGPDGKFTSGGAGGGTVAGVGLGTAGLGAAGYYGATKTKKGREMLHGKKRPLYRGGGNVGGVLGKGGLAERGKKAAEETYKRGKKATEGAYGYGKKAAEGTYAKGREMIRGKKRPWYKGGGSKGGVLGKGGLAERGKKAAEGTYERGKKAAEGTYERGKKAAESTYEKGKAAGKDVLFGKEKASGILRRKKRSGGIVGIGKQLAKHPGKAGMYGATVGAGVGLSYAGYKALKGKKKKR